VQRAIVVTTKGSGSVSEAIVVTTMGSGAARVGLAGTTCCCVPAWPTYKA
jgi:hypothetical protein